MKKPIIIAGTLALASAAMAAGPPARFTSINQLTSEVLTGLQGSVGDTGRILLPPDGEAGSGTVQSKTVTVTPAGVRHAAARVSLSGAKFTGWLTANNNEEGGYYRLDTDGSYKMLWTNKVSELGITLLNGWVKDGKLCGLGSFTSGEVVLYYNYLEFDLATGAPITETPIGKDNLIDLSNYYVSSTYVPEEDRVYGYTYSDSNGTGYSFCSSPATDIADVTVIKTLELNGERTGPLCYHAEDGLFYGVDYAGNFISIDRQGNQTILFKLPLATMRTAPSGLVYSPFDDCFIFCAYYYDYATQLYYIHPESREIDFVSNFPADYQFTFLLNDDYKYDATAPGRPELVSTDIDTGTLSGSMTYRLPDKTAGGASLSGELDWNFYIDNVPCKSGKGTAGSSVNVEIAELQQGLHVIRMVASADGKTGLSCVETKYFGNGVPLSPQNVSIDGLKVSWDAVTEAKYGAYLDLTKLSYDVHVNGEYAGSTTDTQYTLRLDSDKDYSAYFVTVTAKCNGISSEKSDSKKLLYGKPLALPYHITPTRAEADLTVAYNMDGSPSYGEWDFSEARWFEPVFYSGWNKETADDWLILPPVDCSDLSHAFRITLDAVCGGSDDESFEVWCGSAPTVEAMKTLIIPETNITRFITDGWYTFSNLFLPKEAGPCYIAVRAVSPPESYSLLIRNINIEKTDELAEVPMAPSELTLVSKSDAELTATMSFKMPGQTIAGTTIAMDAPLKAILKCGETIVEQDANPGETVTLTVGTMQGVNRIEALCSLNGQNGQSASLELFTGTIPPNYVENLNAVISPDNRSLQLTWEEPVRGQENLEGYYSPEGMSYWLYELVWNEEYETNEWLPTKHLGNVHEYTYSVDDNARLAQRYVGIMAANNGGVSEALSYVFKVIGKPYDTIDEHFDNGQTHYSPLVVKTPSEEYRNSGWQMVSPEDVMSAMWSADIPYAMIGYTDNENGGKNRMTFPKVKSAGLEYPTLTLTLWTGETSGKVAIYASDYDNQTAPEKIYDVPADNAMWKTFNIALPEKYQDKEWVELAIDCTLDTYNTYTLVGNYSFGKGEAGVSGTTLTEACNIYTAGGSVIATGFEDGPTLCVYNIDGTLQATANVCDGKATVPVTKGIYLARCKDRTVKLHVR